MPKKQKDETEAERLQRLTDVAHEVREAGIKEDNALDAMVRKSIEQHGP